MLGLKEALGKASARLTPQPGSGRGVAVRQSCPSCAQHQALPSACCGAGQCPLRTGTLHRLAVPSAPLRQTAWGGGTLPPCPQGPLKIVGSHT